MGLGLKSTGLTGAHLQSVYRITQRLFSWFRAHNRDHSRQILYRHANCRVRATVQKRARKPSKSHSHSQLAKINNSGILNEAGKKATLNYLGWWQQHIVSIGDAMPALSLLLLWPVPYWTAAQGFSHPWSLGEPGIHHILILAAACCCTLSLLPDFQTHWP